MVKRCLRSPRLGDDDASCPGCLRRFASRKSLKKHLGAPRWELHRSSKLTASACASNSACQKVLRRRIAGPVSPSSHRRERVSSRELIIQPMRLAGNVMLIGSLVSCRPVPDCISDVTVIESGGISLSAIDEVEMELLGMSCVEGYSEDLFISEKRAFMRFLVLVLYSLHMQRAVALLDCWLSEHTVGIAIGTAGMAVLDDVRCFAVLDKTLLAVYDSPRDRILWIMVAHMLVRPSLIDYMRVLLGIRRTPATKEGISAIVSCLARRHGHVASRMPKGRRTWRQLDVFGVASTQTWGAKYSGSHKLYAQLCDFDTMLRVADGIVSLRVREVNFVDVSNAIGLAGLVSYSPGGYWTCHLARVFIPNFSGVTVLCRIACARVCAEQLFDMGSGSRSLCELGINKKNAYERCAGLSYHCGLVGAFRTSGVYRGIASCMRCV